MAIAITDMTVCDGGNHVSIYVSEDGGEPRAIHVDIDKLDPTRSFAQIAEHMGSVPAEDVEALYRTILVIRNAPAHTFSEMRAAVLAALGA